MRLVLTSFVTLDGVSQGPGAPDEDPSDGFTRGGWLVPYLDKQFVQRTSEWLGHADGLLLGRRTYEAFARDWPQIKGDDPFTVRMNALPKYVVTSTLTSGSWNPTTVLSLEAVADLKTRPGRELQIHGSARLGATLLQAGLIDTVRLAVAPTVLGTGRRLLDHPSAPTTPAAGPRQPDLLSGPVGLRLIRHEATTTGLLLLEYENAGAAQVGSYEGVSAFV
ncbi:dihydrofolate reductase family protein [Actinoplanes sp. NPDC049596]|uniref:dihydrofolate reductase family protein n=1 Tax=unclassified Actinoplanes TaxID=2626549 RepID=UPI003428A841